MLAGIAIEDQAKAYEEAQTAMKLDGMSSAAFAGGAGHAVFATAVAGTCKISGGG